MPACQLIGLKSYFFLYCYSKSQQDGVGGEGEKESIICAFQRIQKQKILFKYYFPKWEKNEIKHDVEENKKAMWKISEVHTIF